MSIYRHDDNGNERTAIIVVDSAGNCVATGTPIGGAGTYYTDANGKEYLLVIAYDETGTEQ